MSGAPPKPAAIAAAEAALLEKIAAAVGSAEIPRFKEALTHASFANESGGPNNQRLEFLGDAVLGLCVSELLSARHVTADEGALTRMRSALVNAGALADWGRANGVGEALALGRGAGAGSERTQTNVLADAVEALVAAVYEARGLEGAMALVREIVKAPLEATTELEGRDPKSELQERLQARREKAPHYRVVTSRGPPDEPFFEVEVLTGDRLLGTGTGRSKRVAERAAAQSALEKEPDTA